MNLPYFIFKDKSSLELGLYILEKSNIKGAERDIEYQSVPGRDGDLVIDNGRYKNVNISYKLEMLASSDTEFSSNVKMLKNTLLSESGYFYLWDTYDPYYFRKASYTGGLEMDQENRKNTCSISFNCKPYRYSPTGQNKITLTASGHINNTEYISSLPYIKITGSGNITLAINDDDFVFTAVDGYIEIDSETMNVYKDTISQNQKMTGGNFPKLTSGANYIAWSGAVTSVEIIPRWCSL